jgi:hypothetical protein
MILVFLSPPEPPESSYSDTDSNNMLAAVSTLRQLAHQVWGSVKCNSGSTVAGATCLIAGASGVAPAGGICFPGKISIVTGALSDVEALHRKGIAQ